MIHLSETTATREPLWDHVETIDELPLLGGDTWFNVRVGFNFDDGEPEVAGAMFGPWVFPAHMVLAAIVPGALDFYIDLLREQEADRRRDGTDDEYDQWKETV